MRTVWRTVEVPDAQCQTSLAHVPRPGGAYLVQYEFFGHGQCTARCFRQLTFPDGRFQLIPCGGDEPPTVGSPIGGDATPPSAAPPPFEQAGAAPPPPPRSSGGEGPGSALAPSP